MKKTKKPTGPACTSSASGGALICVVTGEHAIHSTSTDGRKVRQYATWSKDKDGRIRVITYSSGKKMSEWFEQPPPPRDQKVADAGYCGIKFESYSKFDVCTLAPKHPGLHQNTSTGTREIEVDSKPLPSDRPEEPDGKKCPKPEAAKAPKRQPRVFPGTSSWRGKERASEPAKPAPLTKIGKYSVHPAAALFPMIGDAEWPTFVEDIRANGQRKKIVGINIGASWQILDGRNRLRACIELGREPKFRTFGDEPGDGNDPIAFVVSENIHRRHLNETQRAFVGAELVPMYEAQAKERMLAGKKDPTLNSGQGRADTSAELAAKAVNVGKSSIEAALKVNRDATPEVIAASKDRGQMKVSTAAQLSTLPKQKQREIVQKLGGGELRSGKVRSLVNQEKKREVVRSINEQRVEPAPLGPFGVIVIDPPWPYENSDQHEGSRGHLDYPSMSIHDICELRSDLDRRAKEDCILGLWVTNAFIHEVGRILFAWGFDHRSMITWDKEVAGVGMLPRGQTEHLVIATRGAPVHTLNEITTMLRVRKREHSRKPDEMYALLAKHCSGPMIDMFSREHREGWSAWGAEKQKFATEAA